VEGCALDELRVEGNCVEPLTDVRDISRIAYGFMASKALFAALNLDLFHSAG
jgi:hypothetical protein